MSIFEEKINSLVEEFSNKAENEINSGKYNVATPQPSKPVIVNALKIKSALKILFSSSKSSLTEDIVLHFKELERLIPFSSTPKAFHSAWDLRSKNLNKFAADRLANEGAQLIPLNSISNIFGIRDQQGVMLGPNKRLVMGIRHSIGNYDDKLDDLRFTYQPPRKLPGMLRYRWCEFISTKLKIPFTILAAIWLMYSIDEKTKIPIFIVTPVQIINPEKNLNNLNNSLKNPLELQIVSRAEVYTSIHRFNSLQDTDTEINFRNDLDVRFSEEWSFEEIHSSKKGKEVKKWYKDNGKRCPGNICDHIQFGELSDSEIGFGHIIPQDWAKTFPHYQTIVHHPDNLYLTCNKCNSSLGKNFPNKNKTSQEDIEETGTIGDWLRKTKK
jgi:hypothetical protein